MDKDNMVAVPMSWYSGWSYKNVDKGLVIEFGSQYCADGMNAVDWSLENHAAIVSWKFCRASSEALKRARAELFVDARNNHGIDV